MDKEFEEWLRTECFQKPTPEAYDLAKAAAGWAKQHWLDKAVEVANEYEQEERNSRQFRSEKAVAAYKLIAEVIRDIMK